MWLSLIWFILILFVCSNLFCTIANLRIKCVTETKKLLFCFTKILNQASYMTYTFGSEVSLHYWLLWTTVWRGFTYYAKLHCTFIHFCKILSGFILLLFVLFGGVAGKATTSAPRFTTHWCIMEIYCQFWYVFVLRFRTLAILYALWGLCRIVNNSLRRRRRLGLVGLFVC